MINIIGGGIAGLAAAIEVKRMSRRFGLFAKVRVFEPEAWGGGASDITASSRCQAWFHFDGTLNAALQPWVSLALQLSTRRLKRLVPEAFSFPLAIAVDRGLHTAPADECFAALGVDHRPVSQRLLAQWFPTVKLPRDSRAWRVRDREINLRLLGAGMARVACSRGVELVRRGVEALRVRKGRVMQLVLADRSLVAVGPEDTVVLACGASIRPILATAGLEIEGLRHFQSHLVATDAFGLRVLFTVISGANMVPHEIDAGLINVFGNTGRVELSHDGRPLVCDPEEVAGVVRDVRDQLGLQIPAGFRAWPAVKVEIVEEGIRSQLHHVRRVSGADNLWAAIPGKLSQSAACGFDLARRLVHEQLTAEYAQSIWEDRDVPVEFNDAA